MIKIKVGGPQATVELKARRALDGSLLIMDHNKIDIAVMPKQMKAVVSEINKVKKNQKPDNNQPGGIIDKEMPIHISNLSFYDPELKKGVRIGYRLENDKKIRINKSSSKEIS